MISLIGKYIFRPAKMSFNERGFTPSPSGSGFRREKNDLEQTDFIRAPLGAGFHRDKLTVCRGFTFIEIMVTCAVLSVGLVMIYKSFLSCLDYQNHMINRVYALTLLDDTVTQCQRDFIKAGPATRPPGSRNYVAVINRKPVSFDIEIAFSPVEVLKNIVQLDLAVVWTEHGRKIRLPRTVYLGRMSTPKNKKEDQ